ncbi:MAG: hypothetical protein HY049_15770 [Acidobacteria bacterium]|nr:hypothetical protein [Acidobacteriota bacterium]
MKNIRNKTKSPLKIPLPQGRTLHLGPMKTGQIADAAVEKPAIQKLIKDGHLELLGEGETLSSSGDASGAVHESTHGHGQQKDIRPKGNR